MVTERCRWTTKAGLYYYRARYYDPAVGRFASEDPARFSGRQPNFYAYVWNNPTRNTDPSGKYLQVVGDSASYVQALLYLSQVPAAAQLIQYLAKSPYTYTINASTSVPCDTGGAAFSKITGTIDWNPRCALRCDKGQLQSPAIGLLHEMVHALYFQQGSDFGQYEDQLIINGFETPIAQALGEGTRLKYGTAQPVLVASPTSH